MKKIILAILFLGTSNLFAQQLQDSTLENKIRKLELRINKQEQDIKQISLELDKDYWTYRGVKKETQQNIIQQKNIIDSLNQLINSSNQKLVEINDNLDSKIKQTGENANSQISELDNNLGKNRLYWIIATLATLLLGGLIYWLLGKRIQSSKTDVETQIKNTKNALEEESIKLDNKLVEVLETQLKLKHEETKAKPIRSIEKDDHSLALKVADEIIRIQKNLSRMDESTKGLKQLNSSVKRIQDNFAANGYELVEMLGKEYNEGMKATVNFVQDEDFEEGKRVISRIIKPQVNYKGTMIQIAQIEVTEA
jgi:hypothetical protein